MSSHSLVFDNETSRTLVSNSKRGPRSNMSFTNNTDQPISILATNQDMQGENPAFGESFGFPGIIAPGNSSSIINEPFDGYLFQSTLPATGTVDVTEAG